MTPTYGGLSLFGTAVRMKMIPNANAAQVAAFFGVQGVQAMDGGSRGRIFEISGVMVGTSPAFVQAAETQLSAFADGTTRVLVDTTGTPWQNVVYRNEFSWSGDEYLWAVSLGGWIRPYRCVMQGLT